MMSVNKALLKRTIGCEIRNTWQVEEQLKVIRVTAKRYIDIFEETIKIIEFDVDLFFKLVDKIVVLDEELLRVSLLDGTVIEVEIV